MPLSHTQWRATETEPQRKAVELWISKPRNLALKAAKAADSLAQAGARRQVSYGRSGRHQNALGKPTWWARNFDVARKTSVRNRKGAATKDRKTTSYFNNSSIMIIDFS